jgi:transposase
MLKQPKVYKFRMEPTPRQSDELWRMAGTARFVWNWALARCQTFYRQNQKSLPQGQLSNELTELKSQEPWLYDFDSQSLQQVLQNLSQAYRNHFNRKMRSGFPKFKTKRDPRQSFRIPRARKRYTFPNWAGSTFVNPKPSRERPKVLRLSVPPRANGTSPWYRNLRYPSANSLLPE